MIDLDLFIREPGFEGMFIGPFKDERGGVFISVMNKNRRQDRQIRAATLEAALDQLSPKPVETINLDDL